MNNEDSELLRFPIGRFKANEVHSPRMIDEYILVLEELPSNLREAVKGLSDEQLDTPYRDGGWTVRQVVHHLPDSHLNSYIRFKLAMTEDKPTIRPYHEAKWAELEDAKHAPVDVSLSLLEALHARWVIFLRTLTEDDLKRKFHHPEAKKDFDLATILNLYAWHSKHHLSHITNLIQRKGWNKT